MIYTIKNGACPQCKHKYRCDWQEPCVKCCHHYDDKFEEEGEEEGEEEK